MQVDGATKNYQKYKDDITEWFTKNTSLKFDADYRTWLRRLIKGDPNQSGAINWQDMGIPAYVAEERLNDLAAYFIDDQKTPTSREVIVYMDRSAESRDALLALNEWIYANGWEFEGAAYYQQRLITWLERRKKEIVEKVTATKPGEPAVPVLEWCLTLQYLKAHILGHTIDTTSTHTIIASLVSDFQKDDKIKRETREWNDLVQFVLNKNTEFDSALTFLRRGSATTMGAVHYAVDSKTKSCYRTDELIRAVEKLVAANWDIEDELPEILPAKNLLFNPAALLKSLYANIRKAMKAETEQISSVLSLLTDYIGDINQNNLVETLSAIQTLFSVFRENGVIGDYKILEVKYDNQPIDTAGNILACVKQLTEAVLLSSVVQLTAYSGNALHELSEFLRDLQKIALRAEQEEDKALKAIEKAGGFTGLEEISEAARAAMEALCEQLEEMEVSNDAAD